MMTDPSKRNCLVERARKKYIPTKTRNISEALRIYIEKNPAEKSTVFITKKTKPSNIADVVGRPDCPNCKDKMMLRIINTAQGKQNLKGWKTCWECLKCGYEKYSVKSVLELIKISSNVLES